MKRNEPCWVQNSFINLIIELFVQTLGVTSIAERGTVICLNIDSIRGWASHQEQREPYPILILSFYLLMSM